MCDSSAQVLTIELQNQIVKNQSSMFYIYDWKKDPENRNVQFREKQTYVRTKLFLTWIRFAFHFVFD